MIKTVQICKSLLLAASALGVTTAATAGTSDSVRQAVSPDALDALGAMPTSKDKQAYAAIFAAIDGKNWVEAARLIEAAPKGPINSMARAELYLAAGSPKVEAAQLQALLEAAPWLPQA